MSETEFEGECEDVRVEASYRMFPGQFSNLSLHILYHQKVKAKRCGNILHVRECEDVRKRGKRQVEVRRYILTDLMPSDLPPLHGGRPLSAQINHLVHTTCNLIYSM